MSDYVKLIECFNSYQGEGPDCGQAMMILRFRTCNLKCPWCDTSVKMRISMEASYYLKDIQDTINKTRSGILITGGEPTVKRHFDECLALLNNLDYPIANVETNGHRLEELIQQADPSKQIHFIYSPKIFNAGEVYDQIEVTQKFLDNPNVFIKVVFDGGTFVKQYIDWLTQQINKKEQFNKVWLMPEGITRSDLIRNSSIVFDACEKYHFNFSSRDHVIYGFI